MRKVIIAVLWLTVFIGCSSTSKKGNRYERCSNNLTWIAAKTCRRKTNRRNTPEKVPSFEQNKVYKDISGFPDYIIGVGDILTISMLRAAGRNL